MSEWHKMLRTGTLIFAMAILAAQSLQASTISYLGLDTTTKANWRLASVAKNASYDPNGDGLYGSDGYYIAYSPLSNANGTPATIASSLPTYLSSVTSPRTSQSYGTFFNSGYAKIDDPSKTDGTYFASTGEFQSGSNSSVEMFDVTLSSDATFVLTIVLGTHDQTARQVSAVSITSTTGASLSETVSDVTANSPKYLFFTLSGVANETFKIYMTGNGTESACTGIAFESVPEPSSTALTIVGAAGLLFFVWQKKKTESKCENALNRL